MGCGGMLYSIESSGSSMMDTNATLEKEVDEKKKLMEEKTRLLDEAIEEMKDKLKEMEDLALAREDENTNKGKDKVDLEDEYLNLIPHLVSKNHSSNPSRNLEARVLRMFHCPI